MESQLLEIIAQELGVEPATAVIVLVVLAIWSTVWKGLALWRAAELRQKWWFVALLFVNTFGLLEIIYLFFITKKVKSEELK